MENLTSQNCAKVIDPQSILVGLTYTVRPCKELKKVLEIDSTHLHLATLIALYNNKLSMQPNEIPIPIQHIEHFFPHTKLTAINMIDILIHHVRFVNAGKQLLYNNKTDGQCEIKVIDLQQELEVNIEIERSNEQTGGVCNVCIRFFEEKDLEIHLQMGPFAESHKSFQCHDIETKMLLAQKIFTLYGNIAHCNYCTETFSLLYHSTDLANHAIKHAGQVLEPNLHIGECRELLWKDFVNNKNSKMHMCVTCHRYFPSMPLLYLHAYMYKHKTAKNICTECRTCYNDTIEEHMIRHHRNLMTCPMNCAYVESDICQHISNRHNHFETFIPELEARKIRGQFILDQDSTDVTGIYGRVKFNRSLVVNIKALLETAVYGTFNMARYTFLDGEGFNLAQKIHESKPKNYVIKREDWPIIRNNPLRIATKLVQIQQSEASVLKHEEASTLVFQGMPMDNYCYNFCHNMRYSKELLAKFDVIVIGNESFKNLCSSQELRMLNLSMNNLSMWNYSHEGETIPEIDFGFASHIEHELNAMDCRQNTTVIIEGSLHPVLQSISAHKRVDFLRSNVNKLAHGYLKLAAKTQLQLKNVAICTYIHNLYSPTYGDELQLIAKYNEIIRVGSMKLQCGLLDIASLGMQVIQTNDLLFFYRVNPIILGPLFDFNGIYTTAAKSAVTKLMYMLEMEKRYVNKLITY